MLPATIGILSLAGLVFVSGLLSARRAAQSRSKTLRGPLDTPTKKLDGDPTDKNRENPAAMAMAGPTGLNSGK
jgi:hypothetical protein